MARSVFIVLTTAGNDTGPFNLYSSYDGFVTPFETGISKAALQGGYLSVLVPNATTVIQVRSTGVCTNFVNISLITYSPTPSPTPSVSMTVTPSVTPTITPTVSATPSLTPTATPGITPSITPSVSKTPSVSVTPSVSITSGVSVTPTPSVSVTPSLSITPSPTPSTSAPNVATLTISFTAPSIGGPTFNATLSKALGSTIRIQNLLVTGYNATGCNFGTDIDSFQLSTNPMSISSGNTFNSAAGGFESNLANRSSVRSQQIGLIGGNYNQISIDPGTGTFVTVNSGGTIVVGSTTVTITVQPCSTVTSW